MALQFITGDFSQNKKDAIIEKLYQISQTQKSAKIYYLVPEHMKFEMEQYLLMQIQWLANQESSTLTRIQVVSFSRLYWFLSKEKDPRNALSDIGISMLIKQILEENADRLFVYRGQEHYLGFVDKLKRLFMELYEGNVLPENLLANHIDEWSIIHGLESKETERLYVIQTLYRIFCEKMSDFTLSSTQSLETTIAYLKANQTQFRNDYLLVDHHYYFSRKEYDVIECLAKVMKQLWISLPIPCEKTNLPMDQSIVDVPISTYGYLKNRLKSQMIIVEDDWQITDHQNLYKADILELAQIFRNQWDYLPKTHALSQQLKLNQQSHHIYHFDSIHTEMAHISNQIHYLVFEKGYRYRDILVMARDMDLYHSVVDTNFKANQIPYFFDHQTNMETHPFVIFLESLFNLRKYHWKYKDLMYVLKSNLYMPAWHPMDVEDLEENLYYQKSLLENLMLEHGYFGYRFYGKNFEWKLEEGHYEFRDYQADFSNVSLNDWLKRWRQGLIEDFYQPFEKWDQSLSGKNACEWLIHLLEKTNVKNQLIALRDQAIEEGDIEGSLRYEQVWKVMVNTLDEFNLLYGDTKVTFDLFSEILLTGLKNATFHIIPPTMDQVLFTSMESPRVQPSKICFVIGLNHQVLPKTFEMDSILSVDNRQEIQSRLNEDQELTVNPLKENQLEALLSYQLLLSAKEELYLSYALSSTSETVKESPLITFVLDHTHAQMKSFSRQSNGLLATQLDSSQIGSQKANRHLFFKYFRHLFETQAVIDHHMASVIKHYFDNIDHHQFKEAIGKLFNFIRLPDRINQDLALSLYGQKLNLTVSRLEGFYKDPFSYFLTYGLRLTERQQFELDPAKTGSYIHDVLDRLSKRLIDNHQQLADLSMEALYAHYEKIVHSLTSHEETAWKYDLFNGHPRFKAIKLQIDQMLWHFVKNMHSQQAKISFKTIMTEADFGHGPNHKLEGLQFTLNNAQPLYLRGIIDRVDRLSEEYMQVVDYKTGKKTFDLKNLYYGLDLQLMAYYLVAANHFKEKKFLGAFYQVLMPDYLPFKDSDHSLFGYDLQPFKKLNGLITVNEQTLMTVDPTLKPKQASLLYPAKLKKDGTFDHHSAVYSEKEVQIMTDYTEKLIVSAANKIQSGYIKLEPFKEESYTDSLRKYRIISGFDATENSQVYRSKDISNKLIVKKMHEELAKGEDND